MLTVNLTSFFHNLPSEVSTVLIAMLPIAELRLALPIALTVYQLPFWTAYTLSVIGNLIPALALLWLLDPLARWLSARSDHARRFFQWLFARTRLKHADHFARYGSFAALALFVAIPLPLTGAWSGAIASFVFGLPRPIGVAGNVLGVLLAGLIVGLTTVGVRQVFR